MTYLTVSGDFIMFNEDDRSKVADKLRKCRGGWSSGECYYTIINTLGLPDTSRNDGGHSLYSVLADLIDTKDERKRYFHLSIPKRNMGNGYVEGGYDIIVDRDHIDYVSLRSDGCANVYINGRNDSFLIYQDAVDSFLRWMES